jgi:hypothetical protein
MLRDHDDIIEGDPLHHDEGNLDPRDEIVRLEAHIEELAAKIESSASRLCSVPGADMPTLFDHLIGS